MVCLRLRFLFVFQTSPDGNVTLSIINYVPSVRDAGKYMSCRAENPELPDSSIEDGWKLEIHCKYGKKGKIEKSKTIRAVVYSH